MAGGGGGGGNANAGDDSAFNVIWMIFFIFLLGAVIWAFWGIQLKSFFLWLKKYQLITIKFVLDLLPLNYFNLGFLKTEIINTLSLVREADPGNLSLDDIQYISVTVGNYMRYPISVLLIFFSYVGFLKNPANKYKRTYDMRSLSLQESSQWPQINPVVGLDLVKEPLNSGPWAMAKSPLEFCKENQLITVTAVNHDQFKTAAKATFKMDLDQEKATIIFTKQLGKLWKSPESLTIYQRAIFAILLARGCREPKVAAKLSEQINRSSCSKDFNKLNFQNVDEIWRKYYNQRIIQEIINTHAYEFTVFIDLLLLARQDGVLATADFLWLKPIDRLFWYVLNSTGRQTIFVEAAGVHAHFLVEKSLGRGLSVPYVTEATKALQLALNDIIYVPSEEEKHALLKQITA